MDKYSGNTASSSILKYSYKNQEEVKKAVDKSGQYAGKFAYENREFIASTAYENREYI